MLKIFLVASIFGWCAQTYAAPPPNRAPDFTIHQEYTSTRALGMGNAFIATVDDHSGIFYNPASLAIRKDSQLRMFVRGGMDKDVLSFNNDIKDANKDDASEINRIISEHHQEHMYFRAPTLGALYVGPKWGIAFIPIDFSVDMALHRSVMSSVFINAYLDSTIAFGRGMNWRVPFLKNKLSFGWTAKVIHRLFYSEVIQATQLITDEDLVNFDRDQEGLTVDGDIGFLYTVKRGESKWFRPTLAFTVRNVFDYGYLTNFKVNNEDPAEPPKLERRFDVGTKFDLPRFWVFDPKFEVDIRDMGHHNWTWKKGLHLGSELYWKMRSWWKGHWSVGVNQGYWTAGFGARLGIFQIDLASWGEEVGTSEYPRESRRYIAEMSLDF